MILVSKDILEIAATLFIFIYEQYIAMSFISAMQINDCKLYQKHYCNKHFAFVCIVLLTG